MIKELLYYFEGLDESILKLNSYIPANEFEFIKYNLNEFEEKFFYLFTIEGQSVKSEETFINALKNSIYFNADEIVRKNKYIIFLVDKRNDNSTNEINGRLNNLIANLKLFKSGHVKLISSFEISAREKESHFPEFPTAYASPSKEEYAYSNYSLNDIDLLTLNYFKNELSIPEYLELAFNSFLESYNVEDNNLRFVILMIALESIFNTSGDQITHTISRHVAILLTIKNDNEKKEELFKMKYKDIKNLYSIRSTIVHSKSDHDKPSKEYFQNPIIKIIELEETVREILQKLIWLHDFESNRPKDKNELFDYLNAKGFPG